MEDGVHLPGWGESEFVGRGGKNLFYFEGSLVFGGKFSRRIMKVEVFVIQPYFFSHFPGHKVGINVVLHEKGSFFVGSNDFFLCFREKKEAFF